MMILGGIMDANDCREYAKRCIEMANTEPDRMQSVLFELAAAWTKLAAELGSNETFRDRAKRLDVFLSVVKDEGSA